MQWSSKPNDALVLQIPDELFSGQVENYELLMFTLPPPGSKGEDGNKREAIREILDQMLDLCDERPKGTCWPLKVCCTACCICWSGILRFERCGWNMNILCGTSTGSSRLSAVLRPTITVGYGCGILPRCWVTARTTCPECSADRRVSGLSITCMRFASGMFITT